MKELRKTYYNKVLRALVCVCACAIYLLGLSGCEEPVEMSYVEIPIQFSLPAERSYVDNSVHRVFGDSLIKRIPGDPGKTEDFDKPTHAYVFVVFNMSNESTIVSCIIDTTILATDWREGLASNGDSVFFYNKVFRMEIPNVEDKMKTADVYIAVSNTSLTLKNGEETITRSPKANWPATKEQVLGIKFVVDDAIQSQLQHIYSSPYNYTPDGSTYYGHISNFSANVPTRYMMLYHVASKVDLMWNVPTDNQNDLRVTKVSVKNLFEGDAYLFKPTETQHDKFTGTGADPNGYTPDDIAGNSPGTWWTGRNYFYTMAYQATDNGNKFPLQVEIKVQDMRSPGTPTKIFDMTLKKAGLGVFTPWMRGQFTITRMPSADVESIDKDI